VLEVKLEAKIDELFDVKLKNLEYQLEKLSGNVSVVCGNYCRQSVDNELSQVRNVEDGQNMAE
jgi:hypothetical protein